MLLNVLVLTAVAMQLGGAVNVALEIGNAVVERTDASLVSFNLDWHRDSEEPPGWINASVQVRPTWNVRVPSSLMDRKLTSALRCSLRLPIASRRPASALEVRKATRCTMKQREPAVRPPLIQHFAGRWYGCVLCFSFGALLNFVSSLLAANGSAC